MFRRRVRVRRVGNHPVKTSCQYLTMSDCLQLENLAVVAQLGPADSYSFLEIFCEGSDILGLVLAAACILIA